MKGNLGAPLTSITARQCYFIENIFKLFSCSTVRWKQTIHAGTFRGAAL
jgi:hypothetical protein